MIIIDYYYDSCCPLVRPRTKLDNIRQPDMVFNVFSCASTTVYFKFNVFIFGKNRNCSEIASKKDWHALAGDVLTWQNAQNAVEICV